MTEHARLGPHTLNQKYFETVLDLRLFPVVQKWAAMYPSDFVRDNCVFAARWIEDEGVFDVAGRPQEGLYSSHEVRRYTMPPSVVFTHYSTRRSPLPNYELTVPTGLLLDKSKPRYTLYRVSFGTSISNISILDSTFSAFGSGYIGITKRSPLQRFREHMRDMRSGNGYLFHTSWRALKKLLPEVTPQFTLCYREETLDAIYEHEEAAVARYTLAPKGLNAIPGGKAGLRMLHMLRDGRPIPTPGERDAILRQMADGRGQGAKTTHYRSGHVRKLADGKKTWVSPCWINLVDAA